MGQTHSETFSRKEIEKIEQTKPCLIDTHCHLHYDYAPKSIEEIISEAHQYGIKTLVTVATDIDSLDKVQTIANSFDNVFFSTGIHPHDVSQLNLETLNILEEKTNDPKCVAIGEIGLDSYYEHSDLKIQFKALENQIAIANATQKTCIFHIRGKKTDPSDIIEEQIFPFLKQVKHQAIIHCFGGSFNFAQKCIDLGFFISFSGIVTFKNAESLREIAQSIPINQLLIETDAPYLAPTPFRGKRCEPYMVHKTADLLAHLRQLSLEEFSKITTANAKKAFHYKF